MGEIKNLNQAEAYIKEVASTGGNKTKIDTIKEKNLLAKALANITDEKAQEAIKKAIDSYEPYQAPKPTSKAKPTSTPTKPSTTNSNQNSVNGNGNISIGGGNNNTITINMGVQPNQNSSSNVNNNQGSNTDTTAKMTGNKSSAPANNSEIKPVASSANNETQKAEEAQQARVNGRTVADLLVGYTTDADQACIAATIRKDVNERNVLEFLKGYSNNKGMGDNFFKQLDSEYGFDDAQNLMHKVATYLQRYFKNNGNDELAQKVLIILQESVFRDDQIEELDEIVKQQVQ